LTGGAYFISAYSEPSSSDATSFRIDHNFNQSFSIFGRYNNAPARQQSRNTQALSQFNRIGTFTETLTLGSTQVFTHRLVNEVRLNGSWQDGTTRNIFDGFGGGIEPPESLFFPSSVLGGPRRGIITLNGLSLVSGQPFTSISLGTDELFRQRQINAIDNLTYTVGSHQLKFGIDYRWLSPIIAPAGFVDNAQFPNIAGVYNNLASSALGLKGVGYTLQFPTYSIYGRIRGDSVHDSLSPWVCDGRSTRRLQPGARTRCSRSRRFATSMPSTSHISSSLHWGPPNIRRAIRTSRRDSESPTSWFRLRDASS
jgi:hypothetical protein